MTGYIIKKDSLGNLKENFYVKDYSSTYLHVFEFEFKNTVLEGKFVYFYL